MTLTLSAFLIVYGLFFIIWLLFFLIALYHLLKFGFLGMTTVTTVIFFSVIAFMLVSYSWTIISQIDWQTEVRIFDYTDSDLY